MIGKLQIAQTEASIIEPRLDYDQVLRDCSSAIKISRIMCIFFVVYVHTHLFADIQFTTNPWFVFLSTPLRELFGRSSVPLLSAISGFLMVGYFRRKPARDVIIKRFQVLIIPMVVWAVLGFAFFSMLDGQAVSSLRELLPVTSAGLQPHLGFLRDVFVLALLTPLLISLIKRFHIYGFIFLLGISAISDLHPIILRDQILVYYALGILLALHKIRYLPRGGPLGAAMGVAFVVLFGLLVASDLGAFAIDEFVSPVVFDNVVRRPICALTFWLVAVWLSRRGGIAEFGSRYIEPAIYLLFLSHPLTARLLAGVFAQLERSHGPVTYTIVWMATPFFCLAAAMVICKMLRYMPKPLAVAVSGKA